MAITSETMAGIIEKNPAIDDSDIAISVSELSKIYKIYKKPVDRVIEALSFGRVTKHRNFKALENISFDIKRGEALGIVGRNGAGKSTLLQIIAGTLLPTTGLAKVSGRVSALLELGSGFNLNFTGRENLYLNAAILGMDRKEIMEQVDNIIDFADIGDFIDQPVKTYSSGMQLRLAFSVQTAITPEILIVDEALAVGDSPFQAKCYNRLRDLLKVGTTVIIVTHSNEVIRSFCTTAIWLSAGKIEDMGPAKRVSDAYLKHCMDSTGINTGNRSVNMPAGITIHELVKTQNITDNTEYAKLANQDRMGTGKVRVENFFFIDANGEKIKALSHDTIFSAVYCLKAYEDIDEEIEVGFTVKDLHGNKIICAGDLDNVKKLNIKEGNTAKIYMEMNLPVAAGRYYVTISLWKFSRDNNVKDGNMDIRDSEIYDLVYYAYFFEVRQRKPIPVPSPVYTKALVTLDEDCNE